MYIHIKSWNCIHMEPGRKTVGLRNDLKTTQCLQWSLQHCKHLTFILLQYFSFRCLRKSSSRSRSVLSSIMSGCRERLPMIISLPGWNKISFTTFEVAAEACWSKGWPHTRGVECAERYDFQFGSRVNRLVHSHIGCVQHTTDIKDTPYW